MSNIACPACGSACPSSAKFCSKCGTAVRGIVSPIPFAEGNAGTPAAPDRIASELAYRRLDEQIAEQQENLSMVQRLPVGQEPASVLLLCGAVLVVIGCGFIWYGTRFGSGEAKAFGWLALAGAAFNWARYWPQRRKYTAAKRAWEVRRDRVVRQIQRLTMEQQHHRRILEGRTP